MEGHARVVVGMARQARNGMLRFGLSVLGSCMAAYGRLGMAQSDGAGSGVLY